MQLIFAPATGLVSRPDMFVIAVVQTRRDSDANSVNSACMRVRGLGQGGLRKGGLGCVSCTGTIIQGLATWPSTQPCPLNNSIKWTPATAGTCITRGPWWTQARTIGQQSRLVARWYIRRDLLPCRVQHPSQMLGVICSCH